MKILNRIVTFVLALAVFPAFATRIIIRIVEEPKGLLGESALLEETLTLSELVDLVKDGTVNIGNLFTASGVPGAVAEMKGWLIATVVFIVLALLLALVIMGCALFTQAHKTVMGLSAGGALSCFVAMACFTKFTTPFTEGSLTLADLMPNSMFSGLAGQIAELFSFTGTGDIVIFQLGNAFITMAIIFIGVALWTIAYYVTLPPEVVAAIKNPPAKEKKEKDKKNAKKDVKKTEKKASKKSEETE